ncbi:MAG: glycosyltransferase [Chloroflexota bacterium]|nr:glycosyltransferase [Chloroflexota bacterium]
MPYGDYEAWKTTPIEGAPYLSVIIPAYNEEERIIPTIGAIASHVSELGFPWELIISDDGSKDNTVQLVEELGFANLRVLKPERNTGKGGAVRRGMLAARGKYLLFSDADNSTPIEEVQNLLRKLDTEGYDVAVGSRAALGAEEAHRSPFRRFLSWGLRWIVRNILRTGVRDTQCGFKMYTREAGQHLHTVQTIDGFAFDLEILYLASKFGYRVVEVPVAWIDAPGSKVDTRKEVQRFLKSLVQIKLNDLRGRYDQGSKTSGMRIAVITPYPPSKGTLNEYAYHFVQALRQKREDVSEIVILSDELPKGEQYTSDRAGVHGVPLRVVPAWRFGAWNNALRILKAVRKAKPDAVLFNIQFASFSSGKVTAVLGLLSPALVKLFGFPTTVLLHNIMETVDLKSAGFAKNPLLEALIRIFGNIVTRLLLKVDWVALTIPKYVEILEQKYKANNVLLAPHGSFVETPQPSFELPSGPLQIMAFGKFGTYKKVESMIEAVKLLQTDGRPPLQVVIAGTDSPNTLGYLEGVRKQYEGSADLKFTGYVAEEDVPRIFGDATVVVFPYTSTTGSSGVLHQAGEYGKAVVLPHIGDFAEVIAEEGYTGEFFEPDNVQSLADAIARVIDDPQRRRDIGTQNYIASRGLPILDVVDWYLLHFQELLKQRKR